jgi:hypothetical protein
METLTFMIGKTVNGKIYFRLLDQDSRVLLTSRNYSDLQYCLSDIYCIQCYNDMEWVVDPDDDFKRLHYAIVHEGRVIARSPQYALPRFLMKDLDKAKAGIMSAAVVDTSSLVRFFRPAKV